MCGTGPRRDDERLSVTLVLEQLPVRRLVLHLRADRLLDDSQLVRDVGFGPDLFQRPLRQVQMFILHVVIRALRHAQKQHREQNGKRQPQHVQLPVRERLADDLHDHHARRQHDREYGQRGAAESHLGYFAHVQRYGGERHTFGQPGNESGRKQHLQTGRPHEQRDPRYNVHRADGRDRHLAADPRQCVPRGYRANDVSQIVHRNHQPEVSHE